MRIGLQKWRLAIKKQLSIAIPGWLEEKEKALLAMLSGLGSAAIAFSGGADSSYLASAAFTALGTKAMAFISNSALLPERELLEAITMAKAIGIQLVVLEDGIPEAALANKPDRCYHCKKAKLESIIAKAAEAGIGRILEGSNLDDDKEYRPGSRAVMELGVLSPLKEAGMTKNDIRLLSKRRGLKSWDKPSMACLASRLPYGIALKESLLLKIEKAEDELLRLGFRQVRVRLLETAARIEVAREERSRFFCDAMLDKVSKRFKDLGFSHVCLELEGYSTGSFDKNLAIKEEEK